MANSNSKDGDSIGGIIIIMLFVAAIVFATAPGMLLMYLINTNSELNLDGGQMWTFAVISCLGFIGLLYLILKNWEKSFLYYGILSAAIIVFFLIAGFGFKAEFAENAWNMFF